MTRPVWARWVLCVALALAAGFAAVAQDGAGPLIGTSWLARVSYVVDGDSIWVRPEGGGDRVRLRIDGVDAPEICQSHGPESRDALRALALGQPVRVTVRELCPPTDSGSLYPEPEFCRGLSVMMTDGEAAEDAPDRHADIVQEAALQKAPAVAEHRQRIGQEGARHEAA